MLRTAIAEFWLVATGALFPKRRINTGRGGIIFVLSNVL